MNALLNAVFKRRKAPAVVIIRLMMTVAGFFLIFFLSNVFLPLTLPDERERFSTVVLDSEGYPLRVFADSEGIWRYQVSLDEVSPLYLEALLTFEDRYFYQHPGVNPFSLVRAAMQWVVSGRVISGGSTLTMQVARILYPHSRTMKGKCYQIFRAFQLEWFLNKREILELYLNYVPFGGTIEGVQAASFQYFQKPADKLRHSEAALLAALPQAPSRLRPDRYPERARRARDKVLERLETFAIWSSEDITYARQEPVAVWEMASPMVAPLLSRRLKYEYPDQSVIKTTLDRNIQQPLEEYVKSYGDFQGAAISAAVMVVENATGNVKAYIASSDFSDFSRAGQVDMIQAIRSPGSTLKPLLYALAIDDHLIHSESLMADVPRVSSQYKPGNFSRGFSGPVSVSEALQRSLNIPFVQLIEAYGEQRFVNRLAHVLQPVVLPDGKANAAVILGGAGISLERQVALFSAFGNGGFVRKPTFIAGHRKKESRRLMSREAAWITYTTLREVKLPGNYAVGVSRELLPRVAWKTGTSYGHRDAWAIGVTAGYTIGVWLGRPDGQPMDKKMGVTTAGPLMFTAFELMNQRAGEIDRPGRVKKINICWPDGRSVESGNNHCDKQRLAWTVNGVTPGTLAPERDRQFFNAGFSVLLDPETGLRVNRNCAVSQTVARRVTVWPVALEPWLAEPLRRSHRLPKYHGRCLVKSFQPNHLRLVGAEDGQIFHVKKGVKPVINLRLEGGSGRILWFMNGQLIKKSDNRKNYLLTLNHLDKGDNQLVALDDTGAMARLNLILL